MDIYLEIFVFNKRLRKWVMVYIYTPRFSILIIRELIGFFKYKIIIMDGDAIFTHLHLPLEWLMNRWEISPNKTLSLALDP